MKIVSWNIRQGGGSRLDGIQKMIASHDPDILILPEFGHNDRARSFSIEMWMRRNQAAILLA